MKIFKFVLIPFFVLTLTVLLLFFYKENGDENSMVLGTIVYLPYVILLTLVNFGLVEIGQRYLFRKRLKYLTPLLTTIILTIIFLVTAGQFKIHYWTLSLAEFIILNLIILLLNFIGVFVWTQHKLTGSPAPQAKI